VFFLTESVSSVFFRVSLFAVLFLGSSAQSRLGRISFPTSGSPAAQAHFQTGVLWLHSFGYEEALEEFREAERLDPGFAMAYWGAAMCHSQPVWQTENSAAARDALERLGATAAARAAKASTDRERAWLSAVETLFGPGDKRSRTLAYAAAMERLALRYPADDEAQVFYALALLGTIPLGSSEPPTSLKAGRIAETVLARTPSHPGAAHVAIHAYDDRDHADRGLPAARAYAKIAPDSSHALHMPAHIFLQLGMWDEAAASDDMAFRASDARVKRRARPLAERDYHSLSWLAYEYLQLGKYKAARETWTALEEALGGSAARPAPATSDVHEHEQASGAPRADDLRNDLASIRAHHVVETRQWSILGGGTFFGNLDELFALGMSAARLKDPARAEAALDLLRKFVATDKDEGRKPIALVMEKELEALVHAARGRRSDALTAMAQAAAIEDRMKRPIARPRPIKPAHELFGEMLIEAGKPAEAIPHFERALWRSAGRALSVLGLARAAAASGDGALARRQYETFLKMWHAADPGLPELAEARTFLAGR
jgi:tetratricopeptide (TPR) repeat protein